MSSTAEGATAAAMSLPARRPNNNNSTNNITNKNKNKNKIRKRPVTFGNPSLGTYHGVVYTAAAAVATAGPSSSSEGAAAAGNKNDVLVEGGTAVHGRPLVAMVEVPPEQVPEGVLNLARSHRPWIDHVRIVIEEEEEGTDETEEEDGDGDDKNDGERKHQQESGNNNKEQRPPAAASRSYLVLFEMRTEAAAEQLLADLHGQPYTCLDMSQKCSVYRVVALGEDYGVSLMSPFFAAAVPATVAGSASANVEDDEDDDDDDNHKPPPEDYNCAVCLERMQVDRDSGDSGNGGNGNGGFGNGGNGGGGGGEWASILTTVCNHSFHIQCLLQWQDSPCPVCRYDHSGLNEALSQCHICARTENIFVCLICGVVSCSGGGGGGGGSSHSRPSLSAAAGGGQRADDCNTSRSSGTGDTATSSSAGEEALSSSLSSSSSQHRMLTSHARQHYDETLHAYALDTESQHVWDFAGQGYVHRLLQNKEDGKLVEVNDPTNTASQERSLSPGLSDAQEGEVVHRKLEGFATQYYTLLKSQLEQQRIYYEGRLEEIRREHDTKEDGDGDNKQRKHTTSDLIAALKQERNQLSERLSCLKGRCSKMRDDAAFLKSMNESLEANKALLKKQLADAQQERIDTKRMFDECLPPLQEKVTVLMLQLENEFAAAPDDTNNDKKPAAV